MTNNQVANTTEFEKSKRRAKWFSIIVSIVFAIFFPIFLFISLLHALILDMPTVLGLWIMFMFFCVSLSFLVSIYYIWKNYFLCNFKKTYLFYLLPFFSFAVAFSLDGILQAIFL